MITAEEMDITVINSCKDVAKAKTVIEGALGQSTGRFGTGIGLPTIRRPVTKLIGRLDFQFTADQVLRSWVFYTGGFE